MNRRGLWSPNDVQRYGLVGVAAETADFDVAVTGIERVTERRRACLRASAARSAEARIELP
jgi:hypothetical protein